MKFSIGSKLWTGFTSILIVLLAVGGISYQNNAKLNETAHWVTHTYQVLTKLNEMLSAIQDAETGQRGYLITGEERYLAPYQAAVPNIGRLLTEIKQLTADNPGQQHRLEQIDAMIDGKLDELKETIDLRRNKGLDAALPVVLSDKGKRLMDELRAVAREMENQENELLREREQETALSSQQTVASIVFGFLLAGALVIGNALFLSWHISKPLKLIADSAERIAIGDLSVSFDLSRRSDEVGALMRIFAAMLRSLQDMAGIAKQIAAGDLTVQARAQSEKDILGNAFAAMVNNLRNLTLEIRDGVNVLSASSSEILATTTQVAASTAETATAVSQTTVTVEEVKQTVRLADQKAKLVSDSAQQVAKISQAGLEAVEELISGMGRIREQTAAAAESIVRLSEQSQAIGEIILTVNDLAEQSNLLAVNAAIEAAKAGDQGKGFAVVAQEIKSLAEQSKQATTQVRAILGDIQKATGATVMAIDLSDKAVAAGVGQSDAAGEAIRMLADSIDEAAQAALQIAASSQQQLVGMDQVALAMENIKQASSQNMAGTGQAESAAQNLHELGLKLKQLMGRYKV
ncbi:MULTISPECIES: methyl-accepting chemotaxis protein [Methylomonas]|uniref:Chemotaxis protein n=1 Tax=Methylomonas koyamae TaxID=702114 RepID=A0A177P6U9_9GAMM|nr:CHASE3 domain-containing protein [Methylomonas koyamae]OAI25159.1 chemotaxis protein [Methylomonas koyamae]